MCDGVFSCTVVCSDLQSAGDDHYRCMHFCSVALDSFLFLSFLLLFFVPEKLLKNVTVDSFLKQIPSPFIFVI